MKIRFESSSGNGRSKTGVGYYSRRLIDNVAQVSGAEVQESQFDFLGRQLHPGAQVERVNFPQKVYAKLDFYGLAFPFDLTLKSVDITVFPNYALWPTMRSKKRVVTIHDLSFLKFPEVVESKNLAYLQKVVPRAVKRADLILTVSETVKQELIEHFHVAGDKVFVTPIPPTEEYSQPSAVDVKTKYRIPTEKYLLFASTVEPRKNLDVVLDAYELLPAELRNEYSLVIAGGMGWKSEEIQSKLQAIQATHPHIVTTGYYDQADAAALFQQASLFVMPSLYEGFGMPLLEAMAASTPTIASDIPVFHEVCGGASVFFDPKNKEELANSMISILMSGETANDLVARGKTNLERYSWNNVASSLVKRFEEML